MMCHKCMYSTDSREVIRTCHAHCHSASYTNTITGKKERK